MRAFKLCMVPVLLGGCPEGMNQYVPTPGGYAAQIDGYVGQDVTVLTSELGAPTRTVEMPPNRLMYVWEDLSETHTTVRGRTERDARTGEHTVVVSGGQRIPFDCVTEATVNAAGTIIGTRTEGLGCLGLAPADVAPRRTAAPANLRASNAAPTPDTVAEPVVTPRQPRIAPPEPAAVQAAPKPAMVRPATETRRERRHRLRK
ncbi:MAG: hypothetical protein ACJATT_005844 [Myxococcota bacterium]|jgi:hypothetical protein